MQKQKLFDAVADLNSGSDTAADLDDNEYLRGQLELVAHLLNDGEEIDYDSTVEALRAEIFAPKVPTLMGAIVHRGPNRQLGEWALVRITGDGGVAGRNTWRDAAGKAFTDNEVAEVLRNGGTIAHPGHDSQPID